MDYDIITLATIQCQLGSFNARLKELDYYTAEAEFEVKPDRIRIRLMTCPAVEDKYAHETFTFWTDSNEYNTVDTVRDMLDQVHEHITNLPTGDEVLKQRLTRTIEAARGMAIELNLDEKMINPFVELMKSLASNAITHRK
tara:strand:+ start:763 stop:1185 length:423 start_codon:yes stop_codon:yes gene_type:complete